MELTEIERAIDAAWENRAAIGPATRGSERDAVEAALDLLDRGSVRVAAPRDGGWIVHQWLKKAVLLSFRLNDMTAISGGPGGASSVLTYTLYKISFVNLDLGYGAAMSFFLLAVILVSTGILYFLWGRKEERK